MFQTMPGGGPSQRAVTESQPEGWDPPQALSGTSKPEPEGVVPILTRFSTCTKFL